MKTSFKSSHFLTFFVAAATLSFMSCNNDDDMPGPASSTISEIVTENPQLSTLASALDQAELSDTLESNGPFTVFAPNNEAFIKAGISNVDSMSAGELRPLLTSHLIGGEVKASDIQSGAKQTLNGNNTIYFSKNAQGLFINGNIKVLSSDVDASNGIIHTIDNVITAPTQSLAQLVAGDTDYSELMTLVSAADTSVKNALMTNLQNGYTIFAPANAAFTQLYQTTPKDSLLAPSNKAMLTNILLYHVLPGRVFSPDLSNVTGEVATANPNAKVTFDLSGSTKIVGKTSGASNVTSPNILGTNGVIHKIDKVLIP